MGSYIGIGLIYNIAPEKQIEKELQNIAEYLITRNGIIKAAKFSNDRNGDLWTNVNIKNVRTREDLYRNLVNNYFGQLSIQCDIFGKNDLVLIIRVEKTANNYYGLLFDISEEKLIDEGLPKNIEHVTQLIIQFLIDVYEISRFDYAICDNEAEIIYSPQEFQRLTKKVYSIAAIPVVENGKKKISIIKSDWNIDGLTKRVL